MSRGEVRQLKAAVARHGDAAAMRDLLARSVHFQHTRLALLRCLQAERMGIAIDAGILSYCQRVADALPPATLHAILRRAAAEPQTSSAR